MVKCEFDCRRKNTRVFCLLKEEGERTPKDQSNSTKVVLSECYRRMSVIEIVIVKR